MPVRLSRTTLVIVLTFGLLIFWFFSRLHFHPASPPFFRGFYPPGALRAWLKEEDARYMQAVNERQDLIVKWGPSARQIDPYPSHGEFYTIWDFFIPAFQCPHRVQRLGTLGDGGKWVCGMDRVARKDNCVIYSVGINDESSFEAALLNRAPNCQVWGYDFSVDSFGPEIEEVPDLKRRAHFHSWALGGEDKYSETDNPKMYTLQTLMAMNGHNFIDILKIDIEGAEFESLAALIESYTPSTPDVPTVLPFGQLQIEIHARHGHERFAEFANWWVALERAGLRPFWTEPNLVYVNLVRGVGPELAEYSFINVRGDHALVSDNF
ncbi:hypothetical protein EW146_g10215 [Bondarzewia mesenterica]|uniref:Methyltransferase domain-containing protein n=1 Tax=Bondarzewia mesenterica TaxID=1095465 RepID=A0A4S4L169_9AGAM|nr:hypothetical protein EW146_g10215 [Bondarzewia mesenterica]